MSVNTQNIAATPGEAELFTRFVDSLGFEAPGCVQLPFLDTDEVFAAMALDISALPAAARPFTRYLGLAYASNAALCGQALERQRLALFEAVNAVSLGEDIVLPQPIDPQALVYRIDIRDYRWDRSIDLLDDGQTLYDDAWLAIAAAAAPYAAQYRGSDADIVSAETGSSVPFMPGNAFVHAVAGGDLYYALVGVGRDTEAHRLELGIATHPVYLEPQPGVSWAGFFDPAPRREAVAVRAPQSSPERAYWVIQEQYVDDSESIYDTPFDSESGTPSEILFGLPNGMLGFAIESVEWTRLTSVLSHGGSLDPAAPVGLAACSGCHAGGHRALRDWVRSVAGANELRYNSETLASIPTYYPTQAELDATLAADNVAPRLALERLGITSAPRDPLSRVYYQFELDRMTARRAAAELGVRLETLEAALGRLGPGLSPLSGGGALDRAAFTEAYAAAVCVLHAASLNRPASCP